MKSSKIFYLPGKLHQTFTSSFKANCSDRFKRIDPITVTKLAECRWCNPSHSGYQKLIKSESFVLAIVVMWWSGCVVVAKAISVRQSDFSVENLGPEGSGFVIKAFFRICSDMAGNRNINQKRGKVNEIHYDFLSILPLRPPNQSDTRKLLFAVIIAWPHLIKCTHPKNKPRTSVSTHPFSLSGFVWRVAPDVPSFVSLLLTSLSEGEGSANLF